MTDVFNPSRSTEARTAGDRCGEAHDRCAVERHCVAVGTRSANRLARPPAMEKHRPADGLAHQPRAMCSPRGEHEQGTLSDPPRRGESEPELPRLRPGGDRPAV